ncbi:stage II sporulation protein M [Clostridium cylindrosporum]|uniref:Stage II sporulation protein M n=1 Tax=Clostridium cylindrosporum DSM 605 TaxID=1121307 RepID=A0A0J8D682_CLOCY|nr:stage II sporulation protein M [Clostridium cylindrosporum]KMT21362.1 stage II sporulation protein M [Clostridium cylindrosporum DSM 605]
MGTLLNERVTRNIKENMGIYFLILLFFSVGLAIGGFAIKSLEAGEKQELLAYMNSFFKIYSGEQVSGFSIFIQSAKNNLFSILIIWALSLTIVGVPVALIVVGFRGFILGFSVGFFIESMGLKGLVFSLVGIIPQNIVYIPCILITSALSLTFSIAVIKRKRSKGFYNQGGISIVSYSTIIGTIFLITLLGSLVEGFISPTIIKALSGYFIIG